MNKQRITMDKEYQTADGREARVLTTEAKMAGTPVVALITSKDGLGEFIMTYDEYGELDCKESAYKKHYLVEKQRFEVFYRTLYETGTGVKRPSIEKCVKSAKDVDSFHHVIGFVKYTKNLTQDTITVEFIELEPWHDT